MVYTNFFETIDTEEKAYWLGFIAADGCVTDNGVTSIQLMRKDRGHLEKFSAIFDGYYKIHDLSAELKGTINYSSKISIYAKKCAEDLLKYGITPRKSLTLKIDLSQFQEELRPHFVRGYFDGDGSVFCSNPNRLSGYNYEEWGMNFIGTHYMMNQFKDFFGIDNKILNKQNIFSLDINGTLKAYDCLCKIYQNATIYLDRKHDKFLELSSSQRLNRLVSKRDYFAEEKLTSPLVGLLLGGASIRGLQVQKSYKDKAKLEVVKQIFERYKYNCRLENGKLSIAISPEIRDIYHHKFYPCGNKTVTREILNEVNNDALFIWFYLNSHYVDGGIALGTARYTEEENKIIQKYFKVVHGYEMTMRRQKDKFYLYLSAKYKEEFLNKVYVPMGIEC